MSAAATRTTTPVAKSGRVRIRALRRVDVDATARVAAAAFAEPAAEAEFRALMAMERSRGAVACAVDREGRETIAGFIVTWLSGDVVRVVSLATTPRWRRRGVARRLVERAIRQARRTGRERVALELRATNAAAYRCYAALGFQLVATQPGYYAEDGGDALALALDVAASRP